MKIFISIFIVIFLNACVSHVSPKVGQTTAKDFESDCKWTALKNVEVVKMPDGSEVHQCEHVGAKLFRFRNGVFVEEVNPQEAMAEYEDGVCKSYGLQIGSDKYVDCRMNLAQIRSQNQAAQQYQNQAQAAQMMMLGLGVLNANQATYAPTNNTRIQANCTATQLGNTTHYNCF